MSYHQVAGLDTRYTAPFEHIVSETRAHDRPRRQHTYHWDRRPEGRGRPWQDRPFLSSSEGRQSSAPAGSGRFSEPEHEQRAAYFIIHQADPPRNEPNVLFQGNDFAPSPGSAPCRPPRPVEQSYSLHSPLPRAEEGAWEPLPPSPRSWHSSSPQPIHQHHAAFPHHDGANFQTALSQTSSQESWARRPHEDRTPSPNHGISGPQFFRVRRARTIRDDEAVEQVKANVRRRRQRDSARHRKILLSLIYSPSFSQFDKELQLDQDTLSSIFLAVNSIFFNEALSQRVSWSWSDTNSSPEYDSRIVGRTSLSVHPDGGYKSSIILSRPILSDQKYNRHLLISAFIHELIHCYLFTCCGFAALEHGGHTPGFQEIATIIDEWAGPDTLHLSHMEADLKQFLDPQTQQQTHGCHHSYPADQPFEHSFCCPPPAIDAPRPPQQHKQRDQQHHQSQPQLSRNHRWDHPDLQARQSTFTNVTMTRSASDRGHANTRYGDGLGRPMWH